MPDPIPKTRSVGGAGGTCQVASRLAQLFTWLSTFFFFLFVKMKFTLRTPRTLRIAELSAADAPASVSSALPTNQALGVPRTAVKPSPAVLNAQPPRVRRAGLPDGQEEGGARQSTALAASPERELERPAEHRRRMDLWIYSYRSMIY